MPAIETHPSAEELCAFTLGQLDDDKLADVEAHLAACPECQSKAANAPDDSLVSLLRTIHGSASHRADTVREAVTLPPASVLSDVSASPVTAAFPGAAVSADVPEALARHERYRVVRLLGQGGMGAVYEAEHTAMQRPVALKVINRAFTSNPDAVERFRREVRAASKLSHPNVVTAFDAETAGETHFLVMEYVAGTSLARLVKERGPLPVAQACDCVRQACAGLQHAHERGMVHRDVKPDNLILTNDGCVKVLDFGLAALTAERVSGEGLTETNVVMGTPDYLAPEQAEDARRADGRADVYGLGCTLYYLLTGKVPYPGGTSLQKILAHRERPVPTVPGVPTELAAVVAKMMAKRPEDRYRTPAEAARALAAFAEPQRQKPRRRAGWLVAAGLLFCAALAVAGAVVYIKTDTGVLEIATESDDVEVIVKQGGKVVRIVDTKTNKSITLNSGVYELETKGGEGLILDVEKVTLKRGETVLARIRRTPAPGEVPKDPAPLEPLHRIRGDRVFSFVSLSPDGRHLLGVYPSGKGFGVWQTETGKLILERDNAWLAQFSSDSTQLIACDGSIQRLQVYDVGTRRMVREFDTKTQMYWFSCVVGDRLLYRSSPRTQVWDWSAGKKVSEFETEREAHLTPDGRHVIQERKDHSLRVLDASTGRDSDAYRTVRGLRSGPFSSDGKWLIQDDGMKWTVRDTATGEVIRTVYLGAAKRVNYSGNGRRLLTWGEKRDELRLLDTTTGTKSATLRFPEPVEPSFSTSALCEKGRYAAVGSGDSIYVFRLTDAETAHLGPPKQ